MTAMQTLDSAAAVQSCLRCRLVAGAAGLVGRHHHPACWADRLVAAFPIAAATNALRPACCRPAEPDACARRCVSVDRRLASLVAFGPPSLAAKAAELDGEADQQASRLDGLQVPVLALVLLLPRRVSELRRPLPEQFALALQVRRPQPEPWLRLEQPAGQPVSPSALPVLQRRLEPRQLAPSAAQRLALPAPSPRPRQARFPVLQARQARPQPVLGPDARQPSLAQPRPPQRLDERAPRELLPATARSVSMRASGQPASAFRREATPRLARQQLALASQPQPESTRRRAQVRPSEMTLAPEALERQSATTNELAESERQSAMTNELAERARRYATTIAPEAHHLTCALVQQSQTAPHPQHHHPLHALDALRPSDECALRPPQGSFGARGAA